MKINVDEKLIKLFQWILYSVYIKIHFRLICIWTKILLYVGMYSSLQRTTFIFNKIGTSFKVRSEKMKHKKSEEYTQGGHTSPSYSRG